jgi:hypothetical protein
VGSLTPESAAGPLISLLLLDPFNHSDEIAGEIVSPFVRWLSTNSA